MKKNVFRSVAWGFAALVVVGGLVGSAYAGAGPPPRTVVPEIDSGSAVGAITLLVGGVMTLVERRRLK